MVSGQIDFVRRYLATLQKYLALKKASFGRVLTRSRKATSQGPDFLTQRRIQEPVYSLDPSQSFSSQELASLLNLNTDKQDGQVIQAYFLATDKTQAFSDLALFLQFEKKLSEEEQSFLNIVLKQLRSHLAWIRRVEQTEVKIHKDDLTGLGTLAT